MLGPGEQGFPRSGRLDRAADYRRVFRRGTVHRFRVMALRFAANGYGEPRLGVVVPKREIRLANRRNRVKRLVRESYRRQRARLPAVDIVVQVVAAMDDAEPAEIAGVLDAAWQHIRSSC